MTPGVKEGEFKQEARKTCMTCKFPNVSRDERVDSTLIQIPILIQLWCFRKNRTLNFTGYTGSLFLFLLKKNRLAALMNKHYRTLFTPYDCFKFKNQFIGYYHK